MEKDRVIPVSRAILCVVLCVIFAVLTTYQFVYYSLEESNRAARVREIAELRDATRVAEDYARSLLAQRAELRERLAYYLGEGGDSDEDCLRVLLRRALVSAYKGSITLSDEEIDARVDAYMTTYAASATAAAEKLLFIDFLYREHYRGAYTAGEMEDALIGAYIAAAGDVYGRYYSEEDYAAFRATQAARTAGIGILSEVTEDGIDVLYVHAASPARDRLLPGDRIVGADGARLPDVTTDDLRGKITGEPGTDVVLTVLRGGGEITVTVTRAEITTDSVIAERLTENEKTVGYIRILSFNEQTPVQFSAALAALENDGIDCFIFDLRDNSGGLVSSLAAALDPLLPAGAPICAFTFANTDTRAPVTAGDGEKVTGTFYVLENRATASCAELFCAALRDNGAATLIGETSYGKGTVQGQFLQPDGSCVILSVARYTPPSGENYEGVGVTPDVAVSQAAGNEEERIFRLDRAEDVVLREALTRATAD